MAERRRRKRSRPSDFQRMQSWQRWRRRLKAALYTLVGVAVLVGVAPLAVDRAMGLVKRSGECRLLTVLDADRFRLSCDIVGRQTARLLGADAPGSREVGCREEFVAGLRAKWLARGKLWLAAAVEAELDGFGWREVPLVVITVEGQRLSGWLMEQGLARPDDGYGRGGWCKGELAQLAQGAI